MWPNGNKQGIIIILKTRSVYHIMPESVGSKSFFGAIWNIVLGFFAKSISAIVQLFLPWFISTADTGTAANSLSIFAFLQIFSSPIFQTLLIQKRKKFKDTVSDIFYLSLLSHFATTALIFFVAPSISEFYHSPELSILLYTLAVAHLINAFATVYEAYLKINLLFLNVAIVNCCRVITRSLTTLLLAFFGFGALSLTIPVIFTAIATFVTSFILSPPVKINSPSRIPQSLFKESTYLAINQLWTTLRSFGPCLLCGILLDNSGTGIFYWSFFTAAQPQVLLLTSQRELFLSSLAALPANSTRQIDALLKLLHVSTFITAPCGVLFCLIAEPLIKTIFSEQWHSGIPLIQCFALSRTIQPLAVTTTALLLAQGKNRRLIFVNGISSTALILFAGLAIFDPTPLNLAICTGAGIVFSNMLEGFLSLPYDFHFLLRATKSFLQPWLIAFAAGVITFLVNTLMEWDGVICLITYPGTMLFAFITLSFIFDKVTLDTIISLIRTRLRI